MEGYENAGRWNFVEAQLSGMELTSFPLESPNISIVAPAARRQQKALSAFEHRSASSAPRQGLRNNHRFAVTAEVGKKMISPANFSTFPTSDRSVQDQV